MTKTRTWTLYVVAGLLVACMPATTQPTVATIAQVASSLEPTSTQELMLEPPNYLPDEFQNRDLSKWVDNWKQYQNTSLGFGFEYPAFYDEMDRCKLIETAAEHNGIYIRLGTRINVVVEPADGSSAESYIDGFTKDMSFVEIIPTPIAGQQGFYVTYRYGGLDRLDEVYVVSNSSLRATFEVTGPTACDFWQVRITEFRAFERILQSFSFLRQQ